MKTYQQQTPTHPNQALYTPIDPYINISKAVYINNSNTYNSKNNSPNIDRNSDKIADNV